MITKNTYTFKVDTSDLATQDPSSSTFFRYQHYTTFDTIDPVFKVQGAYYHKEKIPGVKFEFGPRDNRHLTVFFDTDAVEYIRKHQVQWAEVVLVHEIESMLDHLQEYNKMFSEDIESIVVANYQNSETKKGYGTFLDNIRGELCRVPGLPFGYYLTDGGFFVMFPKYISDHEKAIYSEVFTWDDIEKDFPTFKKFVQKKKIDYDALSHWNYGIQLDCKAMQNYLALTPMLMPICIKLGLKMFYLSHQIIDRKLSDELCDQMVAKDLEVINGVANWNELGNEANKEA